MPDIARLLAIMAALREPETGCPWDRTQDFSTIAPYTIEEAYEVADAIARGDRAGLLDELGDLLFQVVYHARLAEERGWFDFAAVVGVITAKMVRRHPHVFAGASPLPGAWEDGKEAERAEAGPGDGGGTLAGVPLALPALTRARKLTARAARVGFDWPDASSVLAKLAEETAELEAELQAVPPARERLADELGDMLFVLANLARKLELDPETCLHRANQKFIQRFRFVEQMLASEGKMPAEASLAEMEAHWQAAKAGSGS